MNPDYAHWYGWARLNLQKAEKSNPGFEAFVAPAAILFRKKR